jgi:glycosyltransferase involved in cell wall biosynthesis
LKIALVSDAWTPQVNGVVRTLQEVKHKLELAGNQIVNITPDLFRSVPCPTYPEIRLAVGAGKRVTEMLADARPDAIHIATEGPLGMAARSHCMSHHLSFTTAYHTRFPEYLHARFRVPTTFTYAMLRRFHALSAGVMVSTETIRRELAAQGFTRLRRWSRGVDTELFKPDSKDFFDLPRPVFLTVARVAVEKNLPAFLDLDLPGSKVVVGDGPLLATLKQRYPEVHFAGAQYGADLARHYAAADVFVFPSLTDTFGLVLLEAFACGVPVAAFPVAGPIDVIGDSPAGRLDQDLRKAALAALDIPPESCRQFALQYTWERCAEQFVANLTPVR